MSLSLLRRPWKDVWVAPTLTKKHAALKTCTAFENIEPTEFTRGYMRAHFDPDIAKKSGLWKTCKNLPRRSEIERVIDNFGQTATKEH